MLHDYCHYQLPVGRGLEYFDMFDMEGLLAMPLSWNEIRAVEVLLTKDENA